MLSFLSILVVYSATGTLAYKMMDGNTEHYLFKHSGLVLLSLGAMWVAHKIDYKYYSKLSRLALWASVPLLIITWKYGININEANRWDHHTVDQSTLSTIGFSQIGLDC